MQNIDLRLLLLFDEIFKTGSLSRAAERLEMTQPGASLALGRLRQHFGDKLYVRTSTGMEPTALAQAIVPTVREAIAALQATMSYRLRFEPADADRTFRISMTDVGQIVMLPSLLNRLSELAPHVRVEVSTIDKQIHHELAGGELDLAVGFVTYLEEHFLQQLLFEDGFSCLARIGHPRIGTEITRRQYELESHVVVATSGTGHRAPHAGSDAGKIEGAPPRERGDTELPGFGHHHRRNGLPVHIASPRWRTDGSPRRRQAVGIAVQGAELPRQATLACQEGTGSRPSLAQEGSCRSVWPYVCIPRATAAERSAARGDA